MKTSRREWMFCCDGAGTLYTVDLDLMKIYLHGEEVARILDRYREALKCRWLRGDTDTDILMYLPVDANTLRR